MSIIYKVTNKINGKSYIGQTIYNLKRRKSIHKRAVYRYDSDLYFHNAIRKYGWDGFKWEILEEYPDNLNLAEQWYIRKFDTYKNGYNMTLGGDVNPMKSPEIAKKVSETLKLKGENHSSKRKEVRDKISKSRKGKYGLYKEDNGMYGKKHSQSWRDNHSIRMNGKSNSMYGKKHSEKSKNKMAINSSNILFFIETPIEDERDFFLFNLHNFCKIRNLTPACMYRTSNGEYKQHKGYKVQKVI